MLNLESVGHEVSIISNPKWDTPKKIYLASDTEKDKVKHGFVKLELEDDSKFEPCVDKKTERQVLYVSGMSGSGKSVYVGNYLKKYRKAYPKRPIYVLSPVSDDKAFDILKPLRIKLNELLTEDIPMEDFKDSIVVIDDCDSISDKKIRNKVLSIQNQILEVGRHYNISLCVTSHITCAGNDTKKVLNEAHMIVVFVANMANRNIKYLMDNYLGLDKNQIAYIKKQKTRATTFYKTYPSLVITDKLISFTKNLLDEDIAQY
jgi:Cdc6-like AAA superfamily ATPase